MKRILDAIAAKSACRQEGTRPLGTRPLGTRPLLIAIDGAGGAGKSTLAARLGERLGDLGFQSQIVHIDDFYRPSAQRDAQDENKNEIGGDFDWQRLRDQVLVPLRLGTVACYQRYDWGYDALAEWHRIDNEGVVIVEGVYTLRRELGAFYDLTIWIDCERSIRLARGIARDGEAARGLWEQEWMPAEDVYMETHQPRDRADVVVPNAEFEGKAG